MEKTIMEGRGMKRFFRGLFLSEMVALPLLVAAGFVVSVYFVTQERLSVITSSIVIVAWAVIMATYGRVLWYALRRTPLPRDAYLATGIIMMWTAIAATRVWNIIYILKERPEWMITHWFTPFCFLMVALSGLYFVGTPERGWRYGTIVVLGAAMLFALMLFFNLDRPYLPAGLDHGTGEPLQLKE